MQAERLIERASGCLVGSSMSGGKGGDQPFLVRVNKRAW